MSAIIVLPILFLLSLLVIGLPICIGIFVYKDASMRNMNVVLWVLIAVFAPGFIGLIVYLIVRTEHSGLRCPKCGQSVREHFVNCPYCGASLKEHCKNCDFPLETGWAKCPNCGQDIPAEQQINLQQKKPQDKGLGKVLLLAIGIPVLLCLLLVVGLSLYVINPQVSYGSASIASITPAEIVSDIEISKWITECDAKGEGVYVLCAETETSGEYVNQYLIYRNDGSVYVNHEYDMGGWFKKPTLSVYYQWEDSAGADNLCYMEHYTQKGDTLAVFTDGCETQYQTKSVDHLTLLLPEDEEDD